MSQTHQEAVDEILARFNSVWELTGYPVVWPDIPVSREFQEMIDGVDGVPMTPYARITIRSNIRRQQTLGLTTRKFRQTGVVFIEIFTPTGDGMQAAYVLAEDLRAAYETPNISSYHTWYRDVRIDEQGSEGLWSRVNVTAEWEYETVR